MAAQECGYTARSSRLTPVHRVVNRSHGYGSHSPVPLPATPLRSCLSQTPSTHDGGFSTLPRRHRDSAPDGIPQARRKIVNSALQDYIKSLNSMTRSIVLETETVEKELVSWPDLDDAKKEAVVNDHFIPSEVRGHYEPSYLQEMPESGDWEEWPQATANGSLVLRNRSASFSAVSQDYSQSQPSFEQHASAATYFVQPTCKLHKKQLSFRDTNNVRQSQAPNVPPPRVAPPRDHSLGSDGESPRTTSDEDYEYGNLLGFQRSRLRSYSMRTRRNTKTQTNPARGSTRVSHKNRPMTPDANTNRKTYNRTSSEPSRPSPYVNLKLSASDNEIDTEIDLPDDSLLLDHVQSAPEDDSSTTPTSSPLEAPSKPLRYSRITRAQRTFPKALLTNGHREEETVIHNCHATSVISDENHTESTSSLACTSDSSMPVYSSDDPLQTTNAEVISNPLLLRSASRESLDTDSIAPSITSKSLLEFDEGEEDDDDDAMSEQSHPESMLSSTCSFSYRPKSKTAEMAVMRNRRGKRGGSSYRMTTSEYTDRHTQFKPNMLKRTVSTTPGMDTPTLDEQENGFSQPSPLHPAKLSIPISKHNSVTESVTSDLPRSPDHHTYPISSPPFTPLAHSTHLKDSYKRESGYLSGSSESFANRR